MMDTSTEKDVPDQGFRTPRSRRESGPVPAALSSSSHDGLPTPCTSGGVGKHTTEREEVPRASQSIGAGSTGGKGVPRVVLVKVIKPGPKSPKAPAFRRVKATASSPPPLTTPTDEEERRGNAPDSDDTTILSPVEDTPSSDVSTRTTASGTIKRRKGENIRAPKAKKGRACKRQRDPVVDLSSGEEEELAAAAAALSPRRKTRGKPTTTGEGFFAREKAQAKRELEELKAQHRQLQRLISGDFEPRDYKGGARKSKESALEAEMRNLPVRDIASQLVLAARRVDEIATKSSNLRGGFVRQLRDAALSMEVGVDALTTRSGGETEAVSSLRAEVAALMEENRVLRAEKERGWAPPPSTSEAAWAMCASTHMDVDEERTAGEDRATGEERTRPPKERSVNKRPTPPQAAQRPSSGEREAYPALRPSIKGRRRNLDAPLEEQPRATPRANRATGKRQLPGSPVEVGTGPGAVAGAVAAATMAIASEQLESRLQLFQDRMLAEMQRFFAHIRGGENQEPSVAAGPAKPGKELARKKKSGAAPKPVPPPRPTKGGDRKRREGAAPMPAAPPVRKAAVEAINTDREEPTWAKVVGRRERRANRPPPPPPPTKPAATARTIAQRSAAPGTGGRKLRPPRTSAVAITCPKGTYAEVMSGVRANVPLAALGIASKEVSVRRGATGATVVEVAGPEREAKADKLATAIRSYLAESGTAGKVDRPVKTADVRVLGLEASVTVAEVTQAVAEKGGCVAQNIRAGAIRPAPRGMGSLWLRLPVAAAKKAAEGGVIHVGWSRARIEVLDARPLRCHRCLERGHVVAACSSTVDRSGLCYRCSGTGHTAKECSAPPRCPLCTSIGRKAGHSLGAPECAPLGRRGGATAVRSTVLATSSGAAGANQSSPARPSPRPATGGGSTPEAGVPARSPVTTYGAAMPRLKTEARSTLSAGRSVGLPHAEDAETPKLRRSKRRTTRPLEDGAESEELERAVADMSVDSEGGNT